ncbi:DUF983 domain-containing protein [Bosea caraganae]|uniref:DUF983 domain-containing protein n=1 Tax=Bosea caraganae TaxID=2763117 RepID=A0A370LCR7_9HYPH|nr:DUF983 domain-containing protein [Bosea caraganae]RDJ27606.1 DUF983 domain-containing protein [Bosea caraganae]RDJ29620.1 DUF983 domain-containing protein [Bosea caraganae]
MSVQIHHSVSRPSGRDWRPAISRGLRCRCPSCGQGKLFRAFLKPVDICESCGEALYHQRADDLPPYIVITIVGHIVVGGLVLAEKYANWPLWLHMAVWVPLTIILALALMQPVKGGVIGLQWALRMHGFDGTPDLPERQPGASPGSRP